MNTSPYPGQNKPSTPNDATHADRKRFALRNADQIERFNSLLVHDLRSPVVTAKMALDLLVADRETCTLTEEMVPIIRRSLSLIEERVSCLLDVKRMSSGYVLPLAIGRCDLQALTSEILHDLEIVHGERFLLVAQPRVEGSWDNGSLRRVLENLVNNAIKHGFVDGTVTVKLSQNSTHTVIQVHNVGTPIAAEEQIAIFRPFYRTPNAEHRRTEGWGLGLTFVQGAVQAHHGSIALTSTHDEGTTFTVTLPNEVRS